MITFIYVIDNNEYKKKNTDNKKITNMAKCTHHNKKEEKNIGDG